MQAFSRLSVSCLTAWMMLTAAAHAAESKAAAPGKAAGAIKQAPVQQKKAEAKKESAACCEGEDKAACESAGGCDMTAANAPKAAAKQEGTKSSSSCDKDACEPASCDSGNGESCDGGSCDSAACESSEDGKKGWQVGGTKMKGREVRYLPALGGANNQFVIFGMGRAKRLTDWFSLGFGSNTAVQLQQASGLPWVTSYWGAMPRVGTNVGPIRADFGALLGGGVMLRSGTVSGVDSVLQARPIWTVEPRLELSYQHCDVSYGLVGTYLMSSAQNEFGGYTVGLRYAFKGASKTAK
jgi:hypothetical protein